ncbi:MAG: hypothetical protein AAGD32_15290 [Planctomycetota bacterium]
MRQLDHSAFERASGYIRGHARRIDREAFDVFFGGGEPGVVADALAEYQNEDGGFGHAIEPDFRLPDSTATATTVAFQFLIDADVQPTHEVVRRGVAYLLRTYDEGARSWRPTAPAVAEHPRARWWEDVPPIVYAPNAEGWGNPNIEAIGCLSFYGALVDKVFLNARADESIRWIEEAETMEAHELLCALRFSEWFRGQLPATVERQLVAIATKTARLDPTQWSEYSAQPVWFARRPGTAMAGAFGDSLEANLDFVIEQQRADGSWRPMWRWGRYEDVWSTAEREWSGHLTLQNLKLLAAFGRINGVDAV